MRAHLEALAQSRRLPLLLFLLALVLRVGVIVAFDTYAFEPDNDYWAAGWETGQIAWNLAEGRGFSIEFHKFAEEPQPPRTTAWLAPVFPALVAGVFAVFGSFSETSLLVVLLLQAVFSAAIAAAVCAIGRELGRPYVGALAGLLVAISPTAISVHTNLIWSTTLFTLLSCCVVLLVLRLERDGRIGTAVATGLAVGVSLLTLPSGAFFYAAAALWLLVRRGRARLPHVGLMTAVSVLLLVPWTVRNYVEFDRIFLVKSNAGHELFIGNNPAADGLFHPTRPVERLRPVLGEADVDRLEAAGEVEFSRILGDAAFGFIRENPGRFMRLTAKRVLWFWGLPLQNSWHRLPLPAAARAELRHWGGWIHFGTLGLALGGVFLAVRRDPRWWVPALFLLAYPVPYYLTHVDTTRYRLPVLPFLALFASVALVAAVVNRHRVLSAAGIGGLEAGRRPIGERVRALPGGRAGLAAGICLLLLALALLLPGVRAVAGVVAQKFVAHRLLTFPLVVLGLVALLLAGRRHWGRVALLALVASALTLGYGVARMQARYPDNILLEPQVLADTWSLWTRQDILLGAFQPEPVLKVEHEVVRRAAAPVIDVHFHLASLHEMGYSAAEIVATMDSLGIRRLVDLDGSERWLDLLVEEYHRRYPDRFVLFAVPPLGGIGGPEYPRRMLEHLERAGSLGARGLKIPKSLGLRTRDASGTLVALDDSRLDPLWAKARAMGWPVLMHTADPTAFFDPIGPRNERFEELLVHPEWSFHGDSFPEKSELLRQREALLERHPEVDFIGAHVGSNADDLAYAGELLDRYPNYYVDIASRIPEIGRQPSTARRFFLEHQDRILFGTDGGAHMGRRGWSPARYFRSYFELLETENDYMEYPLYGVLKQGRWRVHGLDLPADVLRKVYFENAAGLLSGAEPSDTVSGRDG